MFEQSINDIKGNLFDKLTCIFIDTNDKKIIRNYKNKQMFTIGFGEVKRKFHINHNLIKNGILLFNFNCSEPMEYEIKPLKFELNYMKTTYWFSSKETAVTNESNIVKAFMISTEPQLIKIIVILCGAILALLIMEQMDINIFTAFIKPD